MLKLLKNLFKVAKLLSVDDSGDFQFARVSFLGKEQKVLMLKPYGLLSNPPVPSMVALWNQQGQESNGIGIADDPKNRTLKDLVSGEVGLSNFTTGDHLLFDADGNFIQVVTTNEFKTIGGDSFVVITGNREVTVGGTFGITCPETSTDGHIKVGTGATGTFTSTDNKSIAVQDGIVIGII
jgi:phage gp45-like